MGLGSILKKALNPISAVKAIGGSAKGIVKGDKGAVKRALGATVGLDIGMPKKKGGTPCPQCGGSGRIGAAPGMPPAPGAAPGMPPVAPAPPPPGMPPPGMPPPPGGPPPGMPPPPVTKPPQENIFGSPYGGFGG